MSSDPSRHCQSSGRHSKGRKWWPIWLCGMLLAACEPRTIEIEGLDELTREIRSQRLQTSLRNPTDLPTQTIKSEQIQAAMQPLRDVLIQIGASQRDLSERHAALTLEMRRWTQLLVQSMQSGRSEEAKKLDQRLAQLETTIIEQDSRHRKVEALIGSALDKTADQLEAFLNHFTGESSPINPVEEPPPTSGAPVKKGVQSAVPKGAAVRTSSKKQSSDGTAAPLNQPHIEDPSPSTPKNVAVPDSNVKPSAGSDRRSPNNPNKNTPNQQASMDWLWALSTVALLSGSMLLFSRRRKPSMAPQPEMQFAAQTAGSIDPSDTSGNQRTQAAFVPTTAETNEAEVEELWAAAALLGEAIDRLKQTDDDAPPELGGAQALPDIPVNEIETRPAIEPSSTIADAGRREAQVIREPDSSPQALPVDAARLRDVASDSGDLTDVEVGSTPKDWQPALDQPSPLAGPELAVETHSSPGVPTESRPAENASRSIPPPSKKFAQPGTTQDPTNLASSPIPLTCQMHLPADKHAASRVQRMLDADPRVLAHPQPTIRAEMGELEIHFALLPGLPAGERSILEQQVRDTGA